MTTDDIIALSILAAAVVGLYFFCKALGQGGPDEWV